MKLIVHKYFVDYCQICGDRSRPLVRDHNHYSNKIRGTLCNRCNSWLSIFERNLDRDKALGKGKYKKWLFEYKEKIVEYLSRPSSNVVYNVSRKESTCQEMVV